MATIVNTPAQDSSGPGIGMMLGAIVILILGVLFFFYGLPMMRGGSGSAPAAQPQPNNTEINLPQPESNNDGGQMPQINVPDKIDVNVNGQGGGQSAPQGSGQ